MVTVMIKFMEKKEKDAIENEGRIGEKMRND